MYGNTFNVGLKIRPDRYDSKKTYLSGLIFFLSFVSPAFRDICAKFRLYDAQREYGSCIVIVSLQKISKICKK